MANSYYKGKIILVTGGAQGIGLGIGQAFAAEGAQVIIADTDEEAGQEAVESIRSDPKPEFILCDVSREEDVQAVLQTIKQKYSQLDVLVNNAGIADPFMGSLEEVPVPDFDKVLAVNLRGTFLCAKYSLPLLRKAKAPAIVNITSTRAFMSEPDTFAYSASKGGLEALTHSLAISLAEDKVRVNAIAPGWIETRNWQKEKDREEPHHRKEDKEQHPVGRVGTPEDIAQAVLFLCSDKAGFITGQSITIDGGMTVKMIYK